MLSLSLACLFAVWSACLSQAEVMKNSQQYTTVITHTVNRSIHAGDIMNLAIDEMFPSLEQDPILQTPPPESLLWYTTNLTEASDILSSVEKQANMTSPVTILFSSFEVRPERECFHHQSVSYSTMLRVCNFNKTLEYVRLDPDLDDMLPIITEYTVEESESILTVLHGSNTHSKSTIVLLVKTLSGYKLVPIFIEFDTFIIGQSGALPKITAPLASIDIKFVTKFKQRATFKVAAFLAYREPSSLLEDKNIIALFLFEFLKEEVPDVTPHSLFIYGEPFIGEIDKNKWPVKRIILSLDRMQDNVDSLNWDLFLTFIESGEGLKALFILNVDEVPNFVVSSCIFVTVPRKFNVNEDTLLCKDFTIVMPLCTYDDELSRTIFYHIATDRSIIVPPWATHTYLLTSCRLADILTDLYWMTEMKTQIDILRLPVIINRILAFSAFEVGVYIIYSPPYEGEENSYMMRYTWKHKSLRMYKQEKFQGNNFIFFFDVSVSGDNYILSYYYEKEYEVSMYVLRTHFLHLLIVMPTGDIGNYKDGKSIIRFNVVGECADLTQVIYEFTITSIMCFKVVDLKHSMMPFDYYISNHKETNFNFTPGELGILGNYIELELKENITGITLKQTNRPFLIELTGLWGKKDKTPNHLEDKGAQTIMNEKDYFLIYNNNGTGTLLNCSNDSTVPNYFPCSGVFYDMQLTFENNLRILDMYIEEKKDTGILGLLILVDNTETDKYYIVHFTENSSYLESLNTDVELIIMNGILFSQSDNIVEFFGIGRRSKVSTEKAFVGLAFETKIVLPVSERKQSIFIRIGNLTTRKGSELKYFTKTSEKKFIIGFTIEGSTKAYLSIYSINQTAAEITANSIDEKMTDILLMTTHAMIVFDKSNERMSIHHQSNYLLQEILSVIPIIYPKKNQDYSQEIIGFSNDEGIVTIALTRDQRLFITVLDLRFREVSPHMLLFSENFQLLKDIDPNKTNLLTFHAIEQRKLIVILSCSEFTFEVDISLNGNQYQLTLQPEILNKTIRDVSLEAYSGSPCINHHPMDESWSKNFIIRLRGMDQDQGVIFINSSKEQISETRNSFNLGAIIPLSASTFDLSIRYKNDTPVHDLVSVKNVVYSDKDPSLDIEKRSVFLKPSEKFRCFREKKCMVIGSQGIRLYDIDKGSTIRPIVKLKTRKKVLSGMIEYDSSYFSDQDMPIYTVASIILEEEGETNTIQLFFWDNNNFRKVEVLTLNHSCTGKRAEVLIKEREENILKLSLHYPIIKTNGTVWVTSYIDLIPEYKDNGTIKEFTINGPHSDIYHTLEKKLAGPSSFRTLTAGQGSTLSYFFFENSGQVGLLYIGDNSRTVFGYHTFSDTCILRSDTTVSCRIFEQDMDIGCIVQCDQTRIEAFKLRVKVDEIEGGTKDKLSGVDVIKLEGYKIPVNYTVLHIVKGENLDFVVVKKKSQESGQEENYILMYDPSTGLIVYRMPQSEVCKNKSNLDCDLKTTYIYQMSHNRIMIVPKNTPLSETLYIRKQKPQIDFNATALQRNGLKDYKLVIHGLTTSENIDLDKLFIYKEENNTWLYITIGVFIFLSLIGIFALVLYKNWGADDEEPSQEEKEAKRKKRVKDSDVHFGSFTSDKTSPSSVLKESLLTRDGSKAH